MAKKTVKITAGLKIDSDSFYQRVQNNSTGRTNIIEHKQPVSGTASVVVTSKPLQVKHHCTSGPNQTEHTSSWTPDSEQERRSSANKAKHKVADDTSALFE